MRSLFLLPVIAVAACGDTNGTDTTLTSTSAGTLTGTGATTVTGAATGTGATTGATTGSGNTGTTAAFELIGTWSDSWGTYHDITAITWTQSWGSTYAPSVFDILWYDNATDTMIAVNNGGNTWYAGLYSRFDWTWSGNTHYYCQTMFDGATQAEAENAPPADASDLAYGCAGWSWSMLY
jgi:hypothetical protein